MLMHTVHPATDPRRSPGWPIAAALVIASLAFVACGDDDNGSASSADLAAFCTKAAETNQPGTLPTPELLAEYQALAPDEISDPVAVLVDAFAAGILDATDVAVMVVQSAVSGAMMALSTDTIVYHRKPQQALSPDD